MIARLAAIWGIVFLLFLSAPSFQNSAATVTQTTKLAFNYSVTLYPANSSWRATITNTGSSVFSNSVSISNAISGSTIQDNEFLLSTNGSNYVSPGQTVHGSFHCRFFNGTSGSIEPCTLSSGSVWYFHPFVGNNTGTRAFDQLGGSISVKANGLIVHGFTYPKIDLTWNTSIHGGTTAKWDLTLNNLGTQTVKFYATLTWQCKSPTLGWLTCTKTSSIVQLTRGNSHSFTISFKPNWNSIPVGKTGLTVTVWATFGSQWHLDEYAYNLVAVR